MLRAILLGLALASPAWSCPTIPGPNRELAFPVRSDPTGPAPRAMVVLTRPAGSDWGWFSGTIDLGNGRCLDIPGPDEPEQFFLLIVRAVLFRPHATGAPTAFAILYESGQIGPMHGMQLHSMFYRVDTGSVVREPVLERRLERLTRPNDSDMTWTRNAATLLAGHLGPFGRNQLFGPRPIGSGCHRMSVLCSSTPGFTQLIGQRPPNTSANS